ncbi:MAG: phosphoribosylformylglycinamidine synthase I [Armatimonadetes bacterium]|nr:phosphoribosylformylglycinamidine synthase I [Armatimonadota bacterium]
MPTARVALIQFPGSNCEWETKRAAEAAGMVCDLFRWNRDPDLLAEYDGYIIGGGFSYQDRVRAGVIATKEPVVERLFSEVMDKGKPVLGICNGAQVLTEAGLVPGLKPGEVEMALAPNRPHPQGRISDFCCRWVYIKLAVPPTRSVFTGHLEEEQIIPIPIAHGEGRFATSEREVLEAMHENQQIVFQYCDADGNVLDDPEICPNGAMENMAGVCNPDGNVLAMMPHPERASFLRQIPADLRGEWGQKRTAAVGDAEALAQPGPGLAIFTSLRDGLLARLAAAVSS